MALGFYENKLKDLLSNPGGYTADPGYQFAVDQGLKAAQRSTSAQRGSGGVMAELTRLGSGYAMQGYGNQVDRMGRLVGQEQQYSLGQEQNANSRRAGDQSFGLGMYRAGNDFTLGSQQNQNNALKGWLDYDLGKTQNANAAQRNANDWAVGWKNANSQDWARKNSAAKDWWDTLGS